MKASLLPLGFALALVLIPAGAQDERNNDLPNTDTHFVAPYYRSLSDWQARRRVLRDQILASAGLAPMPRKTPLHPQIFGRLDRDGYSIEKVFLETLPGYYLGGNLFLPRGSSGKLPGI